MLCLRAIHAYYGEEPPAAFAEDVLPYLSPDLRRELVRDLAIRTPLSGVRLATIYGESTDNGGANGEVVVVGPHASLRVDWLTTHEQSLRKRPAEVLASNDWDAADDWDAEADSSPTPTPLHTLVLLSTALPSSMLSSLPATLTRIALLALPNPVQVYRLPGICPLISFLDLSYNGWLASELSAPGAVGTLARVEWGRWARLEELVVRECGLPEDILQRVNEGRWVDVRIIR